MKINQILLLAIAVAVITALLWCTHGESFSYTAYTRGNIDCSVTPDAPDCQPLPPVNPTPTHIASCAPSDGEWSTPAATQFERSSLNSPCCQPPDYGVQAGYKTCDSALSKDNSTDQCIARCCEFVKNEARKYDPSWYPMARCGCSLWCNNAGVPHFKKWGSAEHYITGDLAEAQTSDSGGFIGGTGFDFSGQ